MRHRQMWMEAQLMMMLLLLLVQREILMIVLQVSMKKNQVINDEIILSKRVRERESVCVFEQMKCNRRRERPKKNLFNSKSHLCVFGLINSVIEKKSLFFLFSFSRHLWGSRLDSEAHRNRFSFFFISTIVDEMTCVCVVPFCFTFFSSFFLLVFSSRLLAVCALACLFCFIWCVIGDFVVYFLWQNSTMFRCLFLYRKWKNAIWEPKEIKTKPR